MAGSCPYPYPVAGAWHGARYKLFPGHVYGVSVVLLVIIHAFHKAMRSKGCPNFTSLYELK